MEIQQVNIQVFIYCIIYYYILYRFVIQILNSIGWNKCRVWSTSHINLMYITQVDFSNWSKNGAYKDFKKLVVFEVLNSV